MTAIWNTYRVYGFTLASDFPFANLPPVVTEERPDLTVTLVAEPPLTMDRWEREPAHTARHAFPDGTPWFTLHRLRDGGEALRFAGIAAYYLWPARIICHLLDPAQALLAELRLLGTVLAYWAERRGVAMLHAAAVGTARGAVGFLAGSGAGKSSLAAMFVRAGHPLLTDDLLPVSRADGRLVGAPGYPQMRLWPDVAERFLGSAAGLSLVHPAEAKLRVPLGAGAFGSFCDRARPLAALYLPERRDPDQHGTAIEIVPLPPAQAAFTLIERSFASFLLYGMPSQRARLTLLAPLARQIPVRRLIYPSGYEHLPRVRQAILDDLEHGQRRPHPGCDHSQIAGSVAARSP